MGFRHKLAVIRIATRPGLGSFRPPLFTSVQSNSDSIGPGACCCCCLRLNRACGSCCCCCFPCLGSYEQTFHHICKGLFQSFLLLLRRFYRQTDYIILLYYRAGDSICYGPPRLSDHHRIANVAAATTTNAYDRFASEHM